MVDRQKRNHHCHPISECKLLVNAPEVFFFYLEVYLFACLFSLKAVEEAVCLRKVMSGQLLKGFGCSNLRSQTISNLLSLGFLFVCLCSSQK